MIETASLLASVDLLSLAERDTALRHVASTNGGEYAGPCPFCGGRDRFRVQPNARPRPIWLCRQCGGGRWHDALDYVACRESLDLKRADDFRRACELLGAVEALPQRGRPPAPPPIETGPPSAEWQAKARNVIEESVTALWSPAGDRARSWLHARGLTDETLRRWHIGYCVGSGYRDTAGLSVPCGIVIPCEVGGVVWYLNVRRATGEPKYLKVKGSRSALFGAETLRRNSSCGQSVAVICEGEFDAMLLHQQVSDLCGVATVGSATATPDLAHFGAYLLPVTRLLLAYDADGAGRMGADKVAAFTRRARRLTLPALPGVKDLTDYHGAGGNLRDWLAFELARLDVTLPAHVTVSSPGHSIDVTSPAHVTPSAGNDVTEPADDDGPDFDALEAIYQSQRAALPELPPHSARDWERVTAVYGVTPASELRNVIHRSAWRDGRNSSCGRVLVTWHRPARKDVTPVTSFGNGMTGAHVTVSPSPDVTSFGARHAMTPSKAVRLAVECIGAEVRRLAFDANLADKLHVTDSFAVKASKRRRELLAACAVLKTSVGGDAWATSRK